MYSNIDKWWNSDSKHNNKIHVGAQSCYLSTSVIKISETSMALNPILAN